MGTWIPPTASTTPPSPCQHCPRTLPWRLGQAKRDAVSRITCPIPCFLQLYRAAVGEVQFVPTKQLVPSTLARYQLWCATLSLLCRIVLPTGEEVLKTVRDFCKSPEIKTMKCGWDRHNNGDKSGLSNQPCDICGFRWTFWIEGNPKEYEPANGSGGSTSSPIGFVSLACRPGRLVIRMVHKILKPSNCGGPQIRPYQMLDQGDLDGPQYKATPIKRCSLDVPNHMAGPITVPPHRVRLTLL